MITVITNDGGEDEYPITLTFNEVLFRVEIPMKQGYQLDLSVSDFNLLIGYEKKLLRMKMLLVYVSQIYHLFQI